MSGIIESHRAPMTQASNQGPRTFEELGDLLSRRNWQV